jgi:hypothetical protein
MADNSVEKASAAHPKHNNERNCVNIFVSLFLSFMKTPRVSFAFDEKVTAKKVFFFVKKYKTFLKIDKFYAICGYS